MSKDLVAGDEGERAQAGADDIDRLRRELELYRAALEEIRDHPFEQSNSPRLTDQLWHFVRWSKATARTALERGGSGNSDS